MPRPTPRTWMGASLFALAFASLASPARAQPAAPEQHAEKAAKLEEAAKKDDELKWSATLGAVLNLGNTRSWTVTGGTNFRIRRGPHAYAAEGNLNYGQADLPEQDPMAEDPGFVDTARSVNLKTRYDYFFTEMDAIFAAAVYRWDTFAGLDARLQGQVGYLRNFFKEEKQRFWGEIGYDVTYDNFHPDPLPDPDDPTMTLDGSQVVHSLRGFAGYDNHVNEAVTLATGLEALMNVQDPKDTRINWDATMTSKLVDKLSMELKVLVKFDNVPVPGNEKTDFTTQLNLVYQLI